MIINTNIKFLNRNYSSNRVQIRQIRHFVVTNLDCPFPYVRYILFTTLFLSSSIDSYMYGTYRYC